MYSDPGLQGGQVGYTGHTRNLVSEREGRIYRMYSDPGLQGGKIGYILYRIYLDPGLQGGKVGYAGYTRTLVSREGR